jgi:hypothetical protein
MSVAVFRVQACRRWVEELPATLWIGLHAGLYLVLTAAAVAWVGPFDFGGLIVSLIWGWPVFGLLTAGFGTCMGLLRVLADLPWYWFRALTLLFFTAPLTVVLAADTPMREVAAATTVQLIMALVLVQPRQHWANQDPA